jgi:hypothetical protein
MSKKNNAPTPKEFNQQIKAIIDDWNNDQEMQHFLLDDYLCVTLGYSKGIKNYRKIPKWY